MKNAFIAPYMGRGEQPSPEDVADFKPRVPWGGGVATEQGITVTHPSLNGGAPTNIPSIWNGNPLEEDQAIEMAIKSGISFPSFTNIFDAIEASKVRSKQIGNALERRQYQGEFE